MVIVKVNDIISFIIDKPLNIFYKEDVTLIMEEVCKEIRTWEKDIIVDYRFKESCHISLLYMRVNHVQFDVQLCTKSMVCRVLHIRDTVLNK